MSRRDPRIVAPGASSLRVGALAERFSGARSGARGSLLAAMLVTLTISAIMMATASAHWSAIMKREREQELIFRGIQIAKAIDAAGAAPTSLEAMTKPPKPSLRKVYPDPMTARHDDEGELIEGTGEWVLITLTSNTTPAVPGSAPAPIATTPSGLSSRTPQVAPILGVHTSSEEKSFGRYAGIGPDAFYRDWKFRILGSGANDSATSGGYELPRPPGFAGVRLPGGPPVLLPGGGGQPPQSPR